MNNIRYLCGINRESWIPCLRASGSNLVWALGFELGMSVGMEIISPVGYPLESSILALIILSLSNFFSTWEEYLVGSLPGVLGGFMIGTWEGSLVGWSLGLTRVYPPESPNPINLLCSFLYILLA